MRAVRFASLLLAVSFVTGMLDAAAASGDLDTTFGPGLNGYRVYYFDLGGNNADTSQVVLTQANGNIVLVGRAIDGASSGRIALVGLLSSGGLDSMFGSGGSTTFALASGPYNAAIPYINAAALDAQGRILVAGDSASDDCSYVARFTTNGTIDASFGTGGVYVACPPSGHYIRFMDITTDANSRPVIAGTYATLSGDFVTNSQFLAARLTTTGALDPAFNSGALYTKSIGLVADSKDHAGAVVLDSAGRIYIGGGAQTDSNRDAIVVLRLTSAGAADTTCASSGWNTLGAVIDSGFVATSAVFRDAHHLVLVGTSFSQSGPAQTGVAYSNMDADNCAPGSGGVLMSAMTGTAGRAVAASDGAVYISYSQALSNTPGSAMYAGIFAIFNPLPWNDTFTGINPGQSTRGTGIKLVGGRPLQAMLAQYSGDDYDFAVARFQNDRIFYSNIERDGAKSTP